MKKVLFMLLVMFALSACQSKDSYVKEFSDFVDKVEMEAADYTDKDWKKADLKFSDLSTNLYAKFEEELNADEKAEIIKLQATYAGLKMKAGVKDAAKKVDKFLDGLKEGTEIGCIRYLLYGSSARSLVRSLNLWRMWKFRKRISYSL